jgi:hypothetical protein
VRKLHRVLKRSDFQRDRRYAPNRQDLASLRRLQQSSSPTTELFPRFSARSSSRTHGPRSAAVHADEVCRSNLCACGVRKFDRAANRSFSSGDRVCAPHTRPPATASSWKNLLDRAALVAQAGHVLHASVLVVAGHSLRALARVKLGEHVELIRLIRGVAPSANSAKRRPVSGRLRALGLARTGRACPFEKQSG